MFETPNSINRVADTVGASSADQLQNQRKDELGQEDFLALLTTQLAQQDPFKPLDNTEFIAQESPEPKTFLPENQSAETDHDPFMAWSLEMAINLIEG